MSSVVARRAIHEHYDRFGLTAEMGGRFRDVRKCGGLIWQHVTVLMGKQDRGAHLIVGRLERADALSRTFGLITDFLRAARFRDIEDSLDAYTSLPPVPELAGGPRWRRS